MWSIYMAEDFEGYALAGARDGSITPGETSMA